MLQVFIWGPNPRIYRLITKIGENITFSLKMENSQMCQLLAHIHLVFKLETGQETV